MRGADLRSRGLRTLVGASLIVVLTAGTAAVAAVPLLLAPVRGDGVITLLLLGSDTGLGRGGNPLSARADAFHLLFVSQDRSRATFVNISRDAYVPVPGQGRSKINACLNTGPQTCVATVEDLFGVNVDNYLLTNFDGLIGAVRQYGGVTVEVDQPLSDGGANITETGQVTLTGEQALTYARDRHHRPRGGFDRTAAQARLLIALHDKLATGGPSLRDASIVLEVLRSHVITDISPGTLLRYGFAAMQLPPGNIQSVVLPGSVGSAGAASVVFLTDQAQAIVADAADDGRLS